MSYTKLFIVFLNKTDCKRKYWKEYHANFSVKRKRAFKKRELEKEQMYERNVKDKDYGAGTGLDIGYQTREKVKRKKRTHCRCGATDHLTTNSKKCPLNKKNLAKCDGYFEKENLNMKISLSGPSLKSIA